MFGEFNFKAVLLKMFAESETSKTAGKFVNTLIVRLFVT